MTVSEMLAAWWAAYSPRLAPSTVHNKQETMRLHINPYIGDISARSIKPKDFDYLLQLSPHVQLACRKILNPAFEWAVKRKIARKNPIKELEYPNYKPKEVEIYTAQELNTLLDSQQGRWLWLPVYLAARTGLRRGEVCGLQWDDIDFAHHFLTVRRSLSAYGPHDIVERPPKTKKSKRRVDLDDDTLAVLQARKEIARTKWVCEAPRRPGGQPNPWNITKMLHDACIEAKIAHHTFHALRHTHATLLMAEGVHPKIVSERLGHSNIGITLDTYSHMVPTMQSAAVDAISRILPSREK